MCLNTNNSEPFIAKEDITAYKIFEKRIRFGIFLFSYIRESLWIYKIPRFARMSPEPSRNFKGRYMIEEGLHAYKTLHEAQRQYCFFSIVAEVIIPKGAKYYISYDNSEIVSNKMKVVKIIKK